ncbi:MAG: hypothetical protein QW231_04190, partial [Candidatus Bathyarchaeia archaeon]
WNSGPTDVPGSNSRDWWPKEYPDTNPLPGVVLDQPHGTGTHGMSRPQETQVFNSKGHPFPFFVAEGSM